MVIEHRLVGKMLEPHALTPARFDLLYMLFGLRGASLEQKHLRRKLGVARSTVSRMLRSLEKLGFVSRMTSYNGGTRSVRLTPLGKCVVRRAMHKIWRPRMLRRALDRMMLFHQREGVENLMRHLRGALGDSSRASYPWHPDDCLRVP